VPFKVTKHLEPRLRPLPKQNDGVLLSSMFNSAGQIAVHCAPAEWQHCAQARWSGATEAASAAEGGIQEHELGGPKAFEVVASRN